jgi:hypothetical protein
LLIETIVRGGFHRNTPRFWQTDHNYRYLGAYRWNEQNISLCKSIIIHFQIRVKVGIQLSNRVVSWERIPNVLFVFTFKN